MKVGSSADNMRYLNTVNDKREAGDEGGHSPGQDHQQQSKKDRENTEIFEVSDEKVGAAIQAFRQDGQTQAHGLSAEMIGKGPGLRVTLKDGSGAIVRQFTGEEFLKLREATSLGRPSGKILDQKV